MFKKSNSNMNRYSLTELKPVNFQDNVGRNQNSEKIDIKVDIASESEEDDVRIVSTGIEKPRKPASSKNYLDIIPNIIKHNNNIKITRLNSNSKSYCTEDDFGAECKKPKLEIPDPEEIPVHKEVLQEKSNENFRGISHLKHIDFQQKKFKCPTVLRNANQAKVTTVDTTSSNSSKVISVSCQTEKYPILSIFNVKNNDKSIEFYTGLQTYEKFLYVFESLGSDAYDLKYYHYDEVVALTILDQFFMTLILLRQHKSHFEMSILFDVTLKDIKNIFITWIRFMKLEWSNIKLPLSYISEIKMNSNKNDATVQEKDSDVEIEYDSKGSSVNDAGSKNGRTTSDKSKSFKKAYKILNGPQNYIESHLMNDIVFVCQALCYFKAKRISQKEKNKGQQ